MYSTRGLSNAISDAVVLELKKLTEACARHRDGFVIGDIAAVARQMRMLSCEFERHTGHEQPGVLFDIAMENSGIDTDFCKLLDNCRQLQ